MEYLFWVSLLLLYLVYDGYLRLLQLLLLLLGDRSEVSESEYCPEITVLITVFNEEDKILARIENAVEQDYPKDKLHILVASDGSTDSTDNIVRQCGYPNVTLFSPDKRLGKSDTQNRAMSQGTGELVVFTDADTRFASDFIRKLTAVFSDSEVGCATGHLLFRSAGTDISGSQSYYWNYELKLRDAESNLGILAVASGACMAIRRSMFTEMDASVGEDCIVPLDTVRQGGRVVHVADAIAYDEMPATQAGEFHTRVRMTLRNWQGTWSRASLLNPFGFPGYALALWMHKVLRWLSPFLLILMTLSVCMLAESSNVYFWFTILLFLFYALAMVGWGALSMRKRIPLAGVAYSFMLANAGFLVGVLKAVVARKVTVYQSR